MIKRPDHETYIKIGAYIIIGMAFLFLIAGLAGSVSVWIVFSYGSLAKKLLSSILLMMGGGILFFLLLALYEFLMEFLSMEEEVEELEKKSQIKG